RVTISNVELAKSTRKIISHVTIMYL
ncbi:hypothetical protein SAI_2066, partial [Streptococcus agalactiae H36B]